jgi:hypothetical protein
VTRFVIVAAPRTGSNLLCTLLNSHPDVLCHHEVFNPGGIYYALDFRGGRLDLGSPAARDRDPLAFLDRLYWADLGHRCVGFKWTRGQEPSVLTRVAGDPRVRTILLRRRNRLKVYASEQVALRTGQWEVYRREDLGRERPMVRVGLAELLGFVEAYEAFYASLRRTAGPLLEVDFEDLFDVGVQGRMLRFLGVDPVPLPLRAASVKQNPTDLRLMIENFDDLAASLARSGLAAELHDRGC